MLPMRKLKPREVKKRGQGFTAEARLEPKPAAPKSNALPPANGPSQDRMEASVLGSSTNFPRPSARHSSRPTPQPQRQRRVETAGRGRKSLSCLTTVLEEEDGGGNRSQTPISLVLARLRLRLSRDRKVGQFGICHGYFRHPHLYYSFTHSQAGWSWSRPAG